MFLHPFHANHTGLVGISRELDINLLLSAYRWGIFPWVEHDDHFFWYSVDPRLVIKPKDVKIQKSMRSYFNRSKFHLRVDTQFANIISHCSQISRRKDNETWISDKFIERYTDLHERGIAHSFETYKNGELVGGLYGIALGKIFYGESMFALEPNASKYAFISLARYLEIKNFTIIDCQQDTPHMRSMGADTISGKEFMNILKGNMFRDDHQHLWTEDVNKYYKEIMNI